MGLLDNNLRRIQGRESKGTLFTDLTGVSPFTDNMIPCKGYNSLVLSFTATTNPVDVQVVGYYADGTTTSAYKLYATDISRSKYARTHIKKEIKVIPTDGSTKYQIDVSMFEFIAVGKTVDNANSLTCKYHLYQSEVDEYGLKYHGMYDLFNGITGLTETWTKVLMESDYSCNAVMYKIVIDAEITGLLAYGIQAGYANKTITATGYHLGKKRYIGIYDKYEAGTHLIVFPVGNFDAIYLAGGGIGARKVISYKMINFEEGSDKNTYSYWDKQTGTVGASNFLKVPSYARCAKVVITGNAESVGGKVSFHYIPESLSQTADVTKSLSFLNNKKIYNLETGAVITNGEIVITSGTQTFYFDPKNADWVSLQGLALPISNIDAQYVFEEVLPLEIQTKLQNVGEFTQPVKILDGTFTNPDLEKFFENDRAIVFKNTNKREVVATLRNVVVWADETSISLSTDGFDGAQEVIQLNATNFPNLIASSEIERVVLMPWSRNATTAFAGHNWRMNIITNKGQVYHNFPSRLPASDGVEQAGDYKMFDESCVWELPERWTPVKTNTGTDADLIATGKYRYLPALPDESYEMHPGINTDNGYGNGGFPAVIEKVKPDLSTVKFSRFYFTDRSRGLQGNPLGFMGGFEPHAKLSLIGTYKSNSVTTGSTRICVFMTNDGGRNWFARYEFGANGEMLSSDGTLVKAATPTFMLRNMIAIGMVAPAGASLFNVIKRSHYIPTADNKEPEKTASFKYGTPVAVASVTGGATDITVVTTVAHGLLNGDIIIFEKQSGASANEWDWLVNTGHTGLSSGDGVIFKAQVINTTTFRLMECIYNPHNPLSVRHIHSINRCKDGYMIGSGELYPEGWIVWLSVRESDSFQRLFPWDDLSFIRINSTAASIQRPLGVILRQDPDNTVLIGVDNEKTDIGEVVMPNGRTDTFRRSSNGVWKGKLIDVDNQALFECIFESQEVCYFFKEVRGTMIHIGQQGHVGISSDGGKTWSECHLNVGDVSRFGGIGENGEIVISNFIFKSK